MQPISLPFKICLWIVALLSISGIIFIVYDYFSPAAKRRRKRKKSYQRLIAKARRPTMTFSEDPPKK